MDKKKKVLLLHTLAATVTVYFCFMTFDTAKLLVFGKPTKARIVGFELLESASTEDLYSVTLRAEDVNASFVLRKWTPKGQLPISKENTALLYLPDNPKAVAFRTGYEMLSLFPFLIFILLLLKISISYIYSKNPQ